MKKILNATILSAALSAIFIGHANADANAVYAGISAAEDSTFGYIGGIRAWNGDISKSGFLLRGKVLYGEYDYKTTAVPGGDVDGDAYHIELGIGYQWVNPGNRISLYGGVDHQNHDLSPNDTRNSTRGSTTGAAVQGEIETLGQPWYGGLIGKYSTANDTYWVRGRAGYKFGSVTVGPEAIGAGNNEYSEIRYGLFLGFAATKSTAVSLSAGHRRADGDNDRKNQSGGYLGVDVSTTF